MAGADRLGQGAAVIPAADEEKTRVGGVVAANERDARSRTRRNRIVGVVKSASDQTPASQTQSAAALDRIRDATDKLTKWIPTDTLSLYVPAVTLISPLGTQAITMTLVAFAVFTPLVILAIAFANGPVPIKAVVSAVLGTTAFLIWSLLVPGSAWEHVGWVSTNETAGGVVAALAGVLFSYLVDGILQRAPA